MQKFIDELDKHMTRIAFQAKLNGRANTWIYHEMKRGFDKAPEAMKPYLQEWLDSRWGDYKLF